MLNAAWSRAAAREGYDAGAMPVFAVGHSLGCKPQLIAACGGDEDTPRGRREAMGETVPAARAEHLFVHRSTTQPLADSVRLLEKFARGS